MSSRDALRILQVKPQTLYSYVSRGLIRRRVKPGHRTSYYNREDIHRLKSRSVARSGHGPAAASAMYWGEPVLETAVTEITPDGPRYREHLAIDLVQDNRSFEAVAEYLWSGIEPPADKTWTNIVLPASLALEFAKVDPSDFRFVLTQSIVLLAKTWSCDPALRDAPCPATSILGVMTGAFGFLGPKREFTPIEDGETVAHGLARALGIKPSEKNVRALNAALVLTADHELTTPTFVARISASAGCDLPSCILAGLQVHFGYEFGLCCDRLETLLDWNPKAAKSGKSGARPAVPRRATPGFDNPLYVHGDPRANLLLDIALELEERHDRASEALQVIAKHFPSVQTRTNLCEALVTLSQALGLPYQAAGGLLALARSAGCIAHVLEQRAQNSIIRPRGKFVGPSANPAG
ncbi:MAG: MerR family transcriptional regulator [Xanthobacteraceae bacterium]|nr:MerR family transcriptional regulator [Xanthobacteraceae bacterium]